MWIGAPLAKTDPSTLDFSIKFETNLAEFNQRLRLPHGRVWTVGHENFDVQSFWCEITCDKRAKVFDNHGSCVPYNSSGSKETSLCNSTLRYLHRVIPNTSLPGMRAKSNPFEWGFFHLAHSQGWAVWYGALYHSPVSLPNFPSQIPDCSWWPHHGHYLCIGFGTPSSTNDFLVRGGKTQFGCLYSNGHVCHGVWSSLH